MGGSKITTPFAILIAGCIIGLAIIGARVIAPYEITSEASGELFRLDTITGQVSMCDRDSTKDMSKVGTFAFTCEYP